MKRQRAASLATAWVVVLGGALAVAAPTHAASSCGATGTSVGVTACRYATVGTDTFVGPYYQPQVTFTVYGARSRPRVRNLFAWGGMTKGTLTVAPGATYQVNVGGPARGDKRQFGGFNGGGDSGRTSTASGSDFSGAGGGGGASDVRDGSFGLLDRLLVGGGGGGDGGLTSDRDIRGGAGGGLAGTDGDSGIGSGGGGGGSQTGAGRSPGSAGSAGFGFGGSGGSGVVALSNQGAGGGGGYFGGGGSGSVVGAVKASGGGGGSGYITPKATDTASETGGQVNAYPAPTTASDLVGERDGRGLVIASWSGTPTTATVGLTSNRTSPVAADTRVALNTKVTTSTGVAAEGYVRFVDYTNANGSSAPRAPQNCPCFNLTGDIIDRSQDGSYVKTVTAGALRGGPDHAIVATYEDLHGEIATVTSAPLAFRVTGPPPAPVDLGITKTADADRVQTGSNIVYDLKVTNHSANAATGVKAQDILPDGVTFSSVGTSANCTVLFGVVTCDFGGVAPGTTETAQIAVRTDRPGLVRNTATVSATEPDPDSSNDSSTATATVDPAPPGPPAARLAIGNFAPGRVLVGGKIVYALTVANRGPDRATGVKVTDVLPDGVRFEAADSSSICTDASGTVTCGFGELEVDTQETAEIVVTAEKAGTISNTASIKGNEIDTDPSTFNDSATATTEVAPVPPPADLAVTTTAPARIDYRGDLRYQITVTNNGPSTASRVIATDVLPANVRFQPAGTSSTCTPDTPKTTVTCDLGDLPSGTTRTVEIVVIPDLVGPLSNTVTVDGDGPDPDESNDASTATTRVQDPYSAPADLAMSATATPARVSIGDDITYRLAVANDGAGFATRVTVTDRLPAEVRFKSASASCSNDDGTVTCDLDEIRDGQSETVDVVVTALRAGQVSNTATVQSNITDPNPANDADTASTHVNTAPDATNDTYTAIGGVPATVLTADGVLTNDGDADGDPLTADVVRGPGHGQLALDPDGSFVYTPEAGFDGTDTFVYLATDPDAASDTATVTVTVTKPTGAAGGGADGGGTAGAGGSPAPSGPGATVSGGSSTGPSTQTPAGTTPTTTTPSKPATPVRVGSLKLGKVAGAKSGRVIAIAATISGPGTIEAIATHAVSKAWSRVANTVKPGTGRLAYARLQPVRTPKGRRLVLVLVRSPEGRRFAARFAQRVITLRVVVKYTPVGGKALQASRLVRVRLGPGR